MEKIKNSMKHYFKNKSILITGGTGSFGKTLVNFLLKHKFPLRRIIIFSRDELKQFEMQKEINENKYKNIRYFLGDVRDSNRLKLAFDDVDMIVHAAALKHVPASEFNPFEFINTNIIGAQNIIENAMSSGVKNVVALSTDKASSPINLYGATKLCSDKLFISANNIVGNRNIKFSVVRYGNVMGSRGSVLHSFLEQKKSGTFFITDKRMTRFNISLEESVSMVLWCLRNSLGGEILVPKLPSFYVIDLAKAISGRCKIKFIGIRAGEKINEEMISEHDSVNTFDLGQYYAIVSEKIFNIYLKKGFKLVKNNFSYSSDKNNFLSTQELKKIVEKFYSKTIN
jgi:UDP-N-acetylglucosamine 4,6-dehydratase